MDTVYACLTTLPDRVKALEETINSLLPQVDGIHLFLHGYNPVDLPVFLENEKIKLKYDVEWGDNGDIDKFHSVKELKGYILVCDDDLIYPPDYAETMINAVERYERKALMSAHGSVVFPLPIANYYMDRYVYPCLEDVMVETPVQVGGTGVMAFHTDILFDLDFTGKLPNMSDIHTAIWAAEKGISIIVVPHLSGWIKHSAYITQDMTIASRPQYNFEMVQAINSRPDLFKSDFQKSKKKTPKVTVVIINSRLKTHPHYVKECYDSIRNQTYKNIQIVVIDNMDKLMTIGKCWNNAVRLAKGKYVLFVGDDDFIGFDYVESLVSIIEKEEKRLDKIAGISSYLTIYQRPGNSPESRQEPRELIPTGMYLRKFLLKNPFREYLVRYVDSEYMDRIQGEGNNFLIHRQQYGYFYRSHPEQQSGFKAMGGAHSVVQGNSTEINKRLKEVTNESK